MSHIVMNEMKDVVLSINTSSTATPVFSPLSAGIDNIQEALNEVVNQYKFMADNGFSRSRISGMAPVWTLTGRRVSGDAAQDWVFARKYQMFSGRETAAQVTFTWGGFLYTVAFDCTIANLSEWGGATEENSAITIEVHMDGAPVVTTAAVTPTIALGAVSLSLTAPVKAAAPQSTITAGTGYTGAIAWSPSAGTFAATTVYTATVTLTAANGYAFTPDFNAIDIIGLPTTAAATSVVVTRNSASLVTIVIVYKATSA